MLLVRWFFTTTPISVEIKEDNVSLLNYLNRCTLYFSFINSGRPGDSDFYITVFFGMVADSLSQGITCFATLQGEHELRRNGPQFPLAVFHSGCKSNCFGSIRSTLQIMGFFSDCISLDDDVHLDSNHANQIL